MKRVHSCCSRVSQPYTTEQIKALLEKHRIRLSKRRGQNFLVSEKYISRIIDACNITDADFVLEIGPGLGALTEGLISSCRRFKAVEFDKGLYAILKERFRDCENAEIVCADILNYKLQDKVKVIGNLPYYITSPIIEYLISNRESIGPAFITVQKEVAQRLISRPGTKSYGSLSCFVQFYTRPSIIFSIPRRVFYPQPAVESALVGLEFLKRPAVEVKNEALFFKIVNAAFGKRRKTLLNALSTSGIFGVDKHKLGKILFDLGIDPVRRGETLNLQEFARIANNIEEKSL